MKLTPLLLLLFVILLLSGCGAGQINTGPELDTFEISARSNSETNRKFITALPPDNLFSVQWTTKGNASQEHTFDFFISDEIIVDDENLGFMFRYRCGAEAAVLTNCISTGKVECRFNSNLEVTCRDVRTSRSKIGLRDLTAGFVIGRICYFDELLNESCTSRAIAVEFHP